MSRFWISWYDDDPLELGFDLGDTPCWISGCELDGADTIVAAVIADNEDAAKALVRAAYGNNGEPTRWRFCHERPEDWSPFCDRFQREDWMRWPSPQDTP